MTFKLNLSRLEITRSARELYLRGDLLFLYMISQKLCVDEDCLVHLFTLNRIL